MKQKMKLLGFNFTKISIEKAKDSLSELKIENQIDIPDITEVKQDVLKSKDELLATKFKYVIKYAPDIAHINLEGNILVSVEAKLAKETMKKWKNKEFPEELRI